MAITSVHAAFIRAGYVYEDTGGGFLAMVRYRPGLVVAVNDGEFEVPTTWNAEAIVCLYEPETEWHGEVVWGTEQILCFEIQIRQLLATHDNSAAILEAWRRLRTKADGVAAPDTWDQGGVPVVLERLAKTDRLLGRLPLPHAVLLGGLLKAGVSVRVAHVERGAVLLIYGRKILALGLAEYLSEQAQQIGGAFWMMFVPGVSAA